MENLKEEIELIRTNCKESVLDYDKASSKMQAIDTAINLVIEEMNKQHKKEMRELVESCPILEEINIRKEEEDSEFVSNFHQLKEWKEQQLNKLK